MRCHIVVPLVVEVLFGALLLAQDVTVAPPTLPNTSRLTSVSAVELSVYRASVRVCSGNVSCDFRQSGNQPMSWDVDVPGLLADHQILTVDYTANNPVELSGFTRLVVRRGDVHQVHIEVAGRGNASATLDLTILVATRGIIPNAVVVEAGRIVPANDWFDSRNGDNRVQCGANEVMNGAWTGLTNWWEKRLRCTTLRLVRQP